MLIINKRSIHYIYSKSYEPVKAIRTVALSPELAGYRLKYVRASMTDTVIGTGADAATQTARTKFLTLLTNTYGGGGNIENIVPLSLVGFDGVLVGRKSAEPRAPEGKDSVANITEAASKAEKRVRAMFNLKATDPPPPNDFFDAIAEKESAGVDLENAVQAVFAVSILDYHAWRRARTGEDVRHLFVDARGERLDVDITIRASQAEAAIDIETFERKKGAFTRHHSAERLAKAGINQAVIDPTKDYAIIQVKNLVEAGIAPVILSSEHNMEVVGSFKENINKKYVDSIEVLSGVIITPISEVRNVREAFLDRVRSPDTPTPTELEAVLKRFSILETQI